MNDKEKNNYINVVASVPSGYIGDGEDKKQLFRNICLCGDNTFDQYTTEKLTTGLYYCRPQVKWFKVVDDKGNVKNKAIPVARIGELFTSTF